MKNARKEFVDQVRRVLEERNRQDEKWGVQNHPAEWWLAILGEEFGELAQAVLETHFGGRKGGVENIRTEALHVTAVGMAMLEWLDRREVRGSRQDAKGAKEGKHEHGGT